MPDTIRVQVLFKEPTKYGDYCDCIYYDYFEFPSISDIQISNDKQARVDAWINSMSNINSNPDPSLQDLINEKNALQSQIDSIDQEILKKG